MIENIKSIEKAEIVLPEIDPKSIAGKNYLINNKLITNSESTNLLVELKKCFSECKKFYFSVAFINFSGLQLLLDSFKELEEKGVKGKIITSTYLNFTEPKALERINEFSNIDLKVFVATKDLGFHTKAYIFENEEDYKIVIGSSNITQRALKSNVEWNVKVVSKKDNYFVKEVLEEFLELWENTDVANEEFLDNYKSFIKELKRLHKDKVLEFNNYEIIKPNDMQKIAIENLKRLRISGAKKALAIAATGTGKTYMAAFDVMNYKPSKMLFLVHREEILRDAEETFKKLVKNKEIKTGLLTGNSKEFQADYLFATINSINIYHQEFRSDEFDYIIVDEAHRSASPSYKKVINYFKPKFLLGMTATPERCDDESIFDIYDNNVALEIRLKEALELNLVLPFHYFGITDIDDIDLKSVRLTDIGEISKRLQANKRVEYIIEKLNFYGYDGDKLKCLGFCVNKEHAKYMADEFNKRGIKSIYLTSDNNPEERNEYIKKLEAEEDELKVIFTVDIFNEGVDIPSINMILMLRPTASPIIFIQQLGRGLRKHNDKSFLTVLDFIGNHNKAFLISMALSGSRFYDKDSLKVSVATQFSSIPGCTNIQMDRTSQERILQQLNIENFNSMKYLKDEYLEFKNMRNRKVPYFLMDYVKYEGAPDPVKFLRKEKTYIGFVSKMEKDEDLARLLSNDLFYNILKELSDKLPIKRIYEFSIIKYLLTHESIDHDQAKMEILKYIDYVDDESVVNAFNFLNQKYYDSSELKHYIKCFRLDHGILSSTLDFKKIIHDKMYRYYIEDTINYGIVRYERSFGNNYYGIPFLKLYEQYTMRDGALLSNFNKKHSSFRGSGLLTNGNDYFLYVDLHKEDNLKESLKYKDKFIDRAYFQWQTPNPTAQSSETGKNIIFNKSRNINLHIFVRKFKEIDKVSQPYIYIGKGDVVEFEGNKPITVKIKIHNQLPISIYTEFVKMA